MTVLYDEIKVNLLGDIGVGKSTLIYTYRYQRPPPVSYIPEGIDFYRKKIILKEKEINLLIFDHPNDRFYQQWFPSYFKNTSLIILCYDVTNRNSFLHLTKWINNSKSYRGNNPMILVGLKRDLLKDTIDTKTVSQTMIRDFTEKYSIETSISLSSLEVKAVNDLFYDIFSILQKEFP